MDHVTKEELKEFVNNFKDVKKGETFRISEAILIEMLDKIGHAIDFGYFDSKTRELVLDLVPNSDIEIIG